jgi:hypothetical protein
MKEVENHFHDFRVKTEEAILKACIEDNHEDYSTAKTLNEIIIAGCDDDSDLTYNGYEVLARKSRGRKLIQEYAAAYVNYYKLIISFYPLYHDDLINLIIWVDDKNLQSELIQLLGKAKS